MGEPIVLNASDVLTWIGQKLLGGAGLPEINKRAVTDVNIVNGRFFIEREIT